MSEVEVHQPVPGAGVSMLPPEEGKKEEFQVAVVRRLNNLSILSLILTIWYLYTYMCV